MKITNVIEDAPLRLELRDALTRQGFSTLTDVQARSLPLILTGRDLMVQSRTGTGKTLAFALPTLNRLESEASGVKILVVAPTRELANQVGAVYARMGRALELKVATLTGGVAYGEQLRALRQGAQIVVGTPGRLNDHLDRKTLDLSGCRTVVLDEADEILDMGFQEDLEKLLGALPTERQTLLFSATLSEEIERIAGRYMHDPDHLDLSGGMSASTTLTHGVYEVLPTAKYEALVNLLHVDQPELAILFCHTKAETESLCKKLAAEGFKVAYLNGDLPQAIRSKTLEAFRSHQTSLLIATDVAARGIDVRGISHVINFDIPRGVETYIHRAGRTGRAGREGKVLNIATPSDRVKLRRIATEAQLKIENLKVPQASEVQKRLRERFFEAIANRTDASDFEDFRELASDLLSNLDPVALVAALLQDVQSATGQLAAGYEVEVPLPRAERREKPEKSKMERSKPKRAERDRPQRAQEAGMVRLQLNLGKVNRVQPGYLVRLICDKSGIKGEAIGAISLFAHHTLIDVKSEVAAKVMQAVNQGKDDRGRRLIMRLAEP